MGPRTQRIGSRRLVWQIYFYSVGLVLLPALGMVVLLRTLEPPWRESLTRIGQHALMDLAVAAPEELEDEVERVAQELSARIALFGLDEALIVASQNGPPALTAEELERVRREGVVTWASERRVASLLVDDGRRLGYGVFVSVRTSKRLHYLWQAVIGALLLAGLASVLLARALTRPLERLTVVARRLGTGDFGVRTHLHRSDELGEVAWAFDDMAARIAVLLRSQKELLANVSHELRTPLSRIRVALDIAAEGDAARAHESLAEIAQDLGELEQLVADILRTAQLDLDADRAADGSPPLRLRSLRSGDLVERAAARFRQVHSSRTLDVEIEDGSLAIRAEAALLRRAIDNLLDNAVKYSEAPSSVSLRARREGEELVIEVADRGIGIDAADLPHLFTPFFRSDRSRARRTGGVGLGLGLAKRIVEAHGGRIRIHSDAGSSTVATVVLPIDVSGDAPPSNEGSSPSHSVT